MAYQTACQADEVWEGDMLEVDVSEHPVLLVRMEGGALRAYQGMCPHQDIPLSEGSFDGKVLMCRAHQWTFDARNGKGINPHDCQLAQYPVREENGQVLVEVEGVSPLFAHS